MGNSFSKAASKAKPSRIPAFGQKPIGHQVAERGGRPAEPMPQASETKSEAIMRDAQDPTFARNLAALGQVRVPGKGMPTLRTDNPMLGILEERRRIDDTAAAGITTPNLLSARGLSNLFDDRKECRTREELDELATEYGMDPRLVEDLARHINSPSIGIVLPSSDPNEQERQVAKWVDPPLSSPELPHPEGR
ncbi:hypothetical protein JCM1841_006317 [Sporobolomyces salmonicolor]